MIRPGLYEARAANATLSETKDGREIVVLDFKTREGERVSWTGYFGPNVGKDNKTLTERTSEQLRCCGWNGDWNDFASAMTKDVDISVREEDYKGQLTCKVAFINRLGEGGFKAKPIAADKAKSFAERMRQETGSPRPRNEHPNAPGPNVGPGDDDLPF